MQQAIVQTTLYESLIKDCRVIVERVKQEAGFVLIKGKYDLGNRILPEYEKFGRAELGFKTQQDLADDLEINQQNISEFIRFANKVNEEYGGFTQFTQSTDASVLSWRKVVREWLPYRKQHIAVDSPLLPDGVYNIIYADPPWRYNFSETKSRSIPAHYPDMDLEEVCNLEVEGVSIQEKIADDSILFLWATNPKLEEALQVIDSWGFEYKTNLVWIKDKIGMGYWFRGQHELLLTATKGNYPTPDPSIRRSGVLEAPRTGHSSKPEEVYNIIESYFPFGKYLELFARNEREGWTTWGDEV